MTRERDVLRELETALDVTPSANFEARVRERVQAQSIRSPRWTWPAAVAVAATVVLAVMLVPDRRVPQNATARRELPANTAPAAAVTSTAAARAVGSTRPTTRGQSQLPKAVNRDAASPVVIVPAGQMAAIQRLVDEVAKGRVVMGPERPAVDAPLRVTALSAVPAIEFDTIALTPLSADVSPNLWR
jgi:hypothetical protein